MVDELTVFHQLSGVLAHDRNAVANMAAGKRRLASRRGLAYAISNSAAAVKAASRGVAAARERVRVATGAWCACWERVRLATGSTAAGGGDGCDETVAGREGVGAGASLLARCSDGAGVDCTLGRALSDVDSAALESVARCVCWVRTCSIVRATLRVIGPTAVASVTLGAWAASSRGRAAAVASVTLGAWAASSRSRAAAWV